MITLTPSTSISTGASGSSRTISANFLPGTVIDPSPDIWAGIFVMMNMSRSVAPMVRWPSSVSSSMLDRMGRVVFGGTTFRTVCIPLIRVELDGMVIFTGYSFGQSTGRSSPVTSSGPHCTE